MNDDDYEPQFLLFAKFHDNDADYSGYITTAWTPLSMLETIDKDIVVKKVAAHANMARNACEIAFGSVPVGREFCQTTQTG